MSVENVNSWISGGGGLTFLTTLIWCRMKIKSQCRTITEMQKAMNGFVTKEVHNIEIKNLTKAIEQNNLDNKEGHAAIFSQLNDLPEKIIKLIK